MTLESLLLRDRVSIITGAATGIGEAIAEIFAQHGSIVIALDKNEEGAKAVAARIRENGGIAHDACADVRDPAAISRVVDWAIQKFGRIDILINNAGMYPRRRFVEMTEQEWDEVQNVNLKGTFLATKLVVPHMLVRKTGHIVNISSVTFFIGKDPLSHYVAAKGGIIGFTRALARELGPDGIHVNCVTPGAIKTESERAVVSDEEALAVIPLQSLRRRIMPVDVANVCAFLCCPLSDGMTGQTLNVDGGWVMP